MIVKIKKTSELTSLEVVEIYNLFEKVFNKKRDLSTFFEQYTNTPLGYSYHSMLMIENEIVGFHSCIPFYYEKENEKFTLALGVDTMIDKEHRDFSNFRKMITVCERKLKDDGFKLRIGFPNDNSFPLMTKGLKHKTIGQLKTYALVRNISGISSKLKYFDLFSRLISKVQIHLSLLSITRTTPSNYIYKKERNSFNQVRYKWFDAKYKIVKKANFDFVYKIMNYEGSDTAFLIDVYPLNKSNFDKAVRHIYNNDREKIDLILYVGYLHFIPLSLISIPRKYEPKHFNFTCNVFDKDYFDESLLDIKNWDVNLSNFDLL